MLVKPMQPENAPSLMRATDAGISMLVKEEQPPNAERPMFATPSGMVMFVKAEQPSNAECPMLFSLLFSPKVTLAKKLQPSNA